ncbi:MAG: hypothetical protein IT223_10100 [Crocinitomicaceae bacterium]|nr:hypothetical protein [Crocinitomicaceae bacterium]
MKYWIEKRVSNSENNKMDMMKLMRFFFIGLFFTSLFSCAPARPGFDYRGHTKAGKKIARSAEKRVKRTGGNLTLFDCSK